MYDSTIFDGIKFFFFASLDKNPPLGVCLIFGKCPKGTKWGSLVLQSGGVVEIIPSKKIDAYATLRLHHVAHGLNQLWAKQVTKWEKLMILKMMVTNDVMLHMMVPKLVLTSQKDVN